MEEQEEIDDVVFLEGGIAISVSNAVMKDASLYFSTLTFVEDDGSIYVKMTDVHGECPACVLIHTLNHSSKLYECISDVVYLQDLQNEEVEIEIKLDSPSALDKYHTCGEHRTKVVSKKTPSRITKNKRNRK